MKNKLFLCIGIFLSLALSRFIPHPPNFTSLIALSFYVPVILGISYIPVLILSFAITDIFIGYHTGTFFTWGSVLIIGLLSKYFLKNFLTRISGAFSGAIVFFIITNFGVWLTGAYGLTIEGLMGLVISISTGPKELLFSPRYSYDPVEWTYWASLVT